MIIKNGKTISSIYKGSQVIDKIYKGTLVVYEAFKKLIVSGIPPLTLTKCKGVDLVDYKIYGESNNVFNIDTMGGRLRAYIVGTTSWGYSDDSYSVRVPVKPNTTYKISMQNQVTIFRAGCVESDKIPVANSPVDIVRGVSQNNNTPITITTTANTKYLVIQSTSSTMEETLKTLRVEPQPTPEAPIEIESVGVKTRNLLKLPVSTLTSNGVTCNVSGNNVASFNGTTTSYPTFTYNVLNIPSNTNVTLSYKTNDTKSVDIRLRNSVSGEFIVVRNGRTVTPTFDVDVFQIALYRDVDYSGFEIRDIQIELGSTVTDFEPSGYKIPVKTSGKNLFDISRLSNTTNITNNNDGTITVSNNAVSAIQTLQELCPDLKAGDMVTFTMETTGNNYIYWYTTTGHSWVSGRTYTVTQEELDAKLTLYTGTISKFQIEKGTVATAYEPYVSSVTTNIYLNEPLRKIGDYADYIDFENKKVVRNIYEYIFTGSEFFENTYGENLFDSPSLSIEKAFIVGLGISNHYKYNKIQAGINSNTLHGEFALQKSSGYKIFFKNVNYSGTNSFKEHLKSLYSQGKPLNVVYPLLIPTEETIELPNIPTLKGTTILEVDTKIQPSNMEVVYKEKPTKLNNIETLEKTDVSIIEEKLVKEVEE